MSLVLPMEESIDNESSDNTPSYTNSRLSKVNHDYFFMDDKVLMCEHGTEVLLSKKRNFYNMRDKIVGMMNFIAHECSLRNLDFHDYYQSLLSISRKYDLSEYLDDPDDTLTDDQLNDIKKEFIAEYTSYIKDNEFNDTLKEIIEEYIEDTYSVNLDEKAEVAKNKNEELQFLDSHAKAILKATCLDLVTVAPIIDFCAQDKRLKYPDVINPIFISVIGLFQEELNIVNKITKIVDSRIRQHVYANQVIYNYLENIGVDPNIIINNIRKVIITDIIPKLEPEKSVVSMFTAVIKFQMDFHFTKKFPVSYKPISIDYRDREESGTLDKIENLSQRDEGFKVLMEADVKRAILRVERALKINYTKEMSLFYSKTLIMNDFQKKLIFQILSKISEIPIDYFYSLNQILYFRALNAVYYFLLEQGYIFLPKLLVSNLLPRRMNKKPPVNFKKLSSLISSESFDQLHKRNFISINDRIRKNEVFLNKFLELELYYINNVITFNEFKESIKNEDINNMLESKLLKKLALNRKLITEYIRKENTLDFLSKHGVPFKKAQNKTVTDELVRLYKYLSS